MDFVEEAGMVKEEEECGTESSRRDEARDDWGALEKQVGWRTTARRAWPLL